MPARKPRQVFILQGSTGEYADYTEWIVGVFTTKAKAEARLSAIREWSHAHRDKFKKQHAKWLNNSSNKKLVAYPTKLYCPYDHLIGNDVSLGSDGGYGFVSYAILTETLDPPLPKGK